jgi:hypothetical protein
VERLEFQIALVEEASLPMVATQTLVQETCQATMVPILDSSVAMPAVETD